MAERNTIWAPIIKTQRWRRRGCRHRAGNGGIDGHVQWATQFAGYH
ncbi:MAG: hypothetical protein ACYSR5_12165 [Planctomycetota bacterium]